MTDPEQEEQQGQVRGQPRGSRGDSRGTGRGAAAEPIDDRPLRLDTPVDWAISEAPVGYDDAVAVMEARATAIAAGEAPELVWLLEHPAIYTAGTSARPQDLIAPDRFPVHMTGRGGQYTYHGPGQRIAYVMLDLNRRGRDVRAFVSALETWVIETLDWFNVRGEIRPDRVGVWVRRPERGVSAEDKVAAIGIRLKRWVSLHGLAINVEPDLDHFTGIVPCGIVGHGITSLVDLGIVAGLPDVDIALAANFERLLGPIRRVDPPLP